MGTDLETWKKLGRSRERLSPCQEVHAIDKGMLPKPTKNPNYRRRLRRKTEALINGQRRVLNNQQLRFLQRQRVGGMR